MASFGLLGSPIKRLECALKVIEGSHRGLSSRWGQVIATVSPGHLELRRQWWRLFRRLEPVTMVEVRGPVRPPSRGELWDLAAGCRIVEQTPTATLGWAVLGDRLEEGLTNFTAEIGEGSPPQRLRPSAQNPHD